MTMLLPILLLLALVAGSDAYVLARRVEQRFDNRATFQGGYGLSNPNSCPSNYSLSCSSSSGTNEICCPQGTTCFGGYLSYCCPTSEDCHTFVNTFPACVDPTANMYVQGGDYFCCAQGFTGVTPSSGFGFCESADVSVAQTLLATMVSQYGGTSVTPFGGFAATPTVSGSPASTGAGVVTGSNTTPTGTTSSPEATSTSSSSIIDGLSNAAFIGIVIAGIIVLAIALAIWRWFKAKVRKSLQNRDYSSPAGPSMMPAYIPTNVPIYEPAPLRSYGHGVYDPVMERRTAVSPMSPPPRSPPPMTPSPAPMTPSPAYSALEQHEMSDGRGMYDPIEVHGMGSTTGRVELG